MSNGADDYSSIVTISDNCLGNSSSKFWTVLPYSEASAWSWTWYYVSVVNCWVAGASSG